MSTFSVQVLPAMRLAHDGFEDVELAARLAPARRIGLVARRDHQPSVAAKVVVEAARLAVLEEIGTVFAVDVIERARVLMRVVGRSARCARGEGSRRRCDCLRRQRWKAGPRRQAAQCVEEKPPHEKTSEREIFRISFILSALGPGGKTRVQQNCGSRSTVDLAGAEIDEAE
jgi:hypothetical protein